MSRGEKEMDNDIDSFLISEGIECPKEMKNMYQVGNWLHFNYNGEKKKVSLDKYKNFLIEKYNMPE